MKKRLRRILRVYARYFPYHWKKEGVVRRFSDLLKLDPDELALSELWFGSQVLCRMCDGYQQRLYYFGTQDRKSEELFSRLLRAGDTVLDVGANIGIYTLLAASKVGVHGRVMSLEPIPETFRELRENVRLNCCKDVSLYQVAAWQCNGTVQMGCPMDPRRHADLYGVGIEGIEQSTLTVKAVRIDDLVRSAGISRVDFIKMDIEGAELPALRGASEVLWRDRPKLMLEVHHGMTSRFRYEPQDIARFLEPLGYQCYAMNEDYRASLGKRSPALSDLRHDSKDNFLFLPSECEIQ